MISIFRRNKSTVGLDIGSGFIKAAVVDHSGDEPVLTNAVYMPLVADAIVEGEIMDPGAVADTVRSLMDDLGVNGSNVVTAVGGRDVIVKKIQMDRMPADDAREVIRWEAEQYVPFDMENVQLDFQILDPDDVGLQMDVLLVAAKRELVDQKIALMRDAGLEPTIVDVDAFALNNAFEFNYPESTRGAVTLVNVGHEISNLILLQDSVPVLTRDIPFGSRRLREDLRRTHGLSPDEADAVMRGRSERQDEFTELLEERASELAMGIERAVAFLSVDGAANLGGPIFVCGGAAGIPRLADAIGARLHARTEIANPLQRLRAAPDAIGLFPLEELAPMLMLPIGLALRGAA
ncbi:MAG TPA: type IV pilus assembly protein PilM [Longimicrobiaceae bacterium]|nr:type IV pilus assembly protein PilM [Longimicrobiaceae bacterium]